MLSEMFLARLRTSQTPLYQLAGKAGADPFWVSRLVSAALAVKARDERVVRLGRLVGLSEEQIFGESPAEITPLPEGFSVRVGTPLAVVEAQMLQETLRATKGNKTLTAKLLGINPSTVSRKLKRANVEKLS